VSQNIAHGVQIVVLSNGFVYVGHVVTNAEWCVITSAYNIRRWGTVRGLGQLVNGPTPNTVLDRVGTVRAPMHALQHLIQVEAAAWTAKLS